MSFLGFLGPARQAARATFFDLSRRTFMTDDGRRMLVDGLAGLTRRPPAPPPLPRARDVYADLPVAPRRTSPTRPVFITARFRTGSTLLWNVFRHVPGCTAFYEPLNERRWFDPSTRGTRIDGTHLGVNDYWREYDGLEKLGDWYREEWTSRRLLMGAEDWDGDLIAYIDGLIDAAPGRAVLQFNRIDFRLPWIRRYYPDAVIIHLYRHPRDQWCSTLVDPSQVPPDVTMEQFAQKDGYYLLSWAADLAYHFPFLDVRTAKHPYHLFYYIWRLSHAFGVEHADYSVTFERLCESPQSELPLLLSSGGVTAYSLPELTALFDDRLAPGRWTRYASRQWFEDAEAACEDVLERWGAASPRSTVMGHGSNARARMER